MAKTDKRFIDFGTTGNKVNSQDLPANYTPTAYTPAQVESEGTDKVSAHLKGINAEIVTTKGIRTDSNEPNGFVNRTDSTLSFDHGTKTLTITGTFSYYHNGTKYTVTGPVTSTIAGSPTFGIYYFYYNGATLTNSDTPWDLSLYTPVAVVYYNNTATATPWVGPESVLFDERHGLTMDWATHTHLHNSFGTIVLGGGFALSGTYSVASGTGTIATNSYGVDSGIILDEDIQISISALTDNAGVGNQYPVYYRVGSGSEWRWVLNNVPYYISGANVAYNQNVLGTWQLTEITSNSTYMNMWLCATNANGTTPAHRFIWIIGQATYTTLANAQNASFSNNDYTGLPVPELAPLWQITMRRESTYDDTGGNTRIEGTKKIVGTRVATSTTFSANIHNNLSGRSDSNTHPATSINTDTTNFDSIIGATDTTVQTALQSINDVFDYSWSAGSLTGFALTEVGDGTVNVATGTVLIRNAATQSSPLKKYTIDAVTGLSLTDNDNNYVIVNYNSGSPVIQNTTSISSTGTDKIILYAITRVGTALYVKDLRFQSTDTCSRMNIKDIATSGGFEHVYGGTVVSHTGTRNVAVTSGAFYFGVTRIAHDAFDTSGASTFTAIYRNGSGGWTRSTGQTQINNTQYDNGTGTLATLDNNKFGVHWLYLVFNTSNHLFSLYGQGNYSTLAEAQAATIPATLPPELEYLGSGVLIGKIIIQKSASSFADIQNPFDTHLHSTSPTDHNGLANLQGGTVSEYYHLTSAQHTVATQAASGSLNGYLTSTDWSTFNGKAPGGASYVTLQAEAGLSAESSLGTLASGVVYSTVADNVSTLSVKTIGNTSGNLVERSADNTIAVNSLSEITTNNGVTVDGVNCKDSYLILDEVSAPGNPSANKLAVYVRDDSGTTKLYCKDSAGVETDLTAGGGSGAPTTATYWTATAESGLSAEVNLGALTTGMLKHTVTGDPGVSVPSTATDGTDYLSPTTGVKIGGNNVSATMEVGTLGNYRLDFITQGTQRGYIDGGGVWYIGGSQVGIGSYPDTGYKVYIYNNPAGSGVKYGLGVLNTASSLNSGCSIVGLYTIAGAQVTSGTFANIWAAYNIAEVPSGITQELGGRVIGTRGLVRVSGVGGSTLLDLTGVEAYVVDISTGPGAIMRNSYGIRVTGVEAKGTDPGEIHRAIGIQIDDAIICTGGSSQEGYSINSLTTFPSRWTGDVYLRLNKGIRFYDSDDSNYVELKTNGSITSNTTFYLPESDGTSGQSMVTDAAGNLSFATRIGGGTGSTDNAILRADGTGGLTAQSSLASIDDNGAINIPSGQTYNINGVAHTHTASDVGAIAAPGSPAQGNILYYNGSSWVVLAPDANKYLKSNGAGANPSWDTVTASSGYTYSTITTDTNAVSNYFYYVDTTSGRVTLTLPTSPADNDKIFVSDYLNKFSTNPCTIARNGKTINGVARDFVLSIPKCYVELVYKNGDWVIIDNCEFFENWRSIQGTFTRTADSTFTVTDDTTNQKIFAVGRPLMFRGYGGTWRYAIITSYSSGTVTIAGAPMTTSDDDEMRYGKYNMVIQYVLPAVSGYFADGATSTLIKDDCNMELIWQQMKAYCVRLAVKCKTDDSGAAQPRVNLMINGASFSSSNTDAGISVSDAAWTYTAVDVNTANYDIQFGEAIEIKVDANGTNDDSSDLSCIATFVLDGLE